jgi:uncharacterized protein
MTQRCSAPDLSAFEIVSDAWTAPFWEASARGELKLPRCGACQRFRWPPGPFCPHCQSQEIEWLAPGPARLYSYTLVRTQAGDEVKLSAPALVEFPEANGVRILAAIVGAAPDDLNIGAALTLGWNAASNVAVPVFALQTAIGA